MTYGEAKKRVLHLMDELQPKADLQDKLPAFFDMGQKEVAKYYPIWREKVYGPDDERVLPADCWEPMFVVSYGVMEHWDPLGQFEEFGDSFTLHYKAWPATVNENTADSTELDTPEEAMLAVIYFVAAKSQEMEYDQRFFANFFAEYQGQLSNLSDRAQGVAVVQPPEYVI